MTAMTIFLFAALAFVTGLLVPGRWAWAPVALPVLFAIGAAAAGNLQVLTAILGIALAVAAVIAGRAVASRREPPAPERSES